MLLVIQILNLKETTGKQNTQNRKKNTRRHTQTTTKKCIHVCSIKKRKTVGGRPYPPFTPTEVEYLTTILGFSSADIAYLEKRKENGVNITSRMLSMFVQRQGQTAAQVIELMKEAEETYIELSDEEDL